LGVKTSIPPPMDVPLKGDRAMQRAWRFAEGIVWVGYGRWADMGRGVRDLMGW